MARSFSSRSEAAAARQAYREDIEGYKQKVRKYQTEKEAYEQRLTTWQKKYKPYIVERGKAIEFRRNISPRLQKKLKKQYQKDVSELQSKEQTLRTQASELTEQKEALISKGKEIEDKQFNLARKRGSISVGISDTRYTVETPLGTKTYIVDESGMPVGVEDSRKGESRIATGEDILSFKATEYQQRQLAKQAETMQSIHTPTKLETAETSVLTSNIGRELFTPTGKTPVPYKQEEVAKFQQVARDYPQKFQETKANVAKVERKVFGTDIITEAAFGVSQGITDTGIFGYGVLSQRPSQTLKQTTGIFNMGGLKQIKGEFEAAPIGTASKIATEAYLFGKATEPITTPLAKPVKTLTKPITERAGRIIKKVVPSTEESIIEVGGATQESVVYYGGLRKPYLEMLPEKSKILFKEKDVGLVVSKVNTGLQRRSIRRGWFGKTRGVNAEPIQAYTVGTTERIGGVYKQLPKRQAEIFRKSLTEKAAKKVKYSQSAAKTARRSRLKIRSSSIVGGVKIGRTTRYSSFKGVGRTKVGLGGKRIQRIGRISGFTKETSRKLVKSGKETIPITEQQGFGVFKSLYRGGEQSITKTKTVTLGQPKPARTKAEISFGEEPIKTKTITKPARTSPVVFPVSTETIKQVFTKPKPTTSTPNVLQLKPSPASISKPIPREWQGVYDVQTSEQTFRGLPRQSVRFDQTQTESFTGKLKGGMGLKTIQNVKTNQRINESLAISPLGRINTRITQKERTGLGNRYVSKQKTSQLQRQITQSRGRGEGFGFNIVPPTEVPRLRIPILPGGGEEKKKKSKKSSKYKEKSRKAEYTPSLVAISGGITTKKKQSPKTSGLPVRPIVK